jgi:hypothetical protein
MNRKPRHVDPSRTGLLRRKMVADVRRRWNVLMSDVFSAIAIQDMFGLKDSTSDVVMHGGQGSGNFGHAGRLGQIGGSAPGKALAWEDPPQPGKGRSRKIKGGFTATGETNTSVGDLGESILCHHAGMHSLLPPGHRQNPLDMKYDGTKYAYEVKTVTSDAREYKIKMKAHEVQEKLAYAKKNRLHPGMIMLILDRHSNTAYAYKRDGIGSYRLTKETWDFMGKVKL